LNILIGNNSITVKDLKKTYKLYNKPIDRLKEAFNFSNKNRHREFHALEGISFSINKGETVGIIGKNGSGKSTLLKIVTGVLTPTDGSVEVNGKVSALLELGAGFNPDYTGVENIYLSGAVMGYSREEIDKKVNDILEFSGIGDFANQPIKTYSSGMFARLAFAVAMNVEPDIFIVDEALSVGDMYFQEKSFTKMKEFRNEGKTILFVSHSLTSVRNFCDRAIWIDKGKIIRDGDASSVCSEYQDYINEQKEQLHSINSLENPNRSNKIFIKQVELERDEYYIDDDIKLTIRLEFNEHIHDYGVGVIVYDTFGKLVTLYNTVRDDEYFKDVHSTIKLIVPNNDFVKGKYYISVVISDEISMFPYDRQDFVASFTIENKTNINGIPIADGYFRSKHIWEY
jgi:ABC-type polysaccharide/polyol phosphate transport system ATPase subunit